ncbi:MAG: insulinase family protein [Flavobacteriales bacterium]|nr:insulinase family protein [Flavobacteriales bacterium]
MKLDRNLAPEIKLIDVINFPAPEKFTLSNGIEVYGFNLGSQEVIQIDLTFDINRSNAKNPFVAKAVNELIGETTRNKANGVLEEEIDFYGAFLESNYSVDHSSVSLFTLTNKLDNVLPLFEEAVKETIFSERELSIFLKNQKHKFLVQQEKVATLARRLYSKLLYGDHYYGQRTELEDFDQTTLDDLTKFYQDYYVAENCSILITGKYNEDIYAKLDAVFGNLKRGKKNNSAHPVFSNIPAKEVHLKEDAVQSAIRIGKILDVEFGSDDYFRLKVLNTVLGGYFGSRLMMNIREDKGYTYGIGSGLNAMLNAVVFSIATEVGSDVTSDALNEIYKEISKLCTEKITDEELQTVKNHMLGSLLSASDGPFSIAQQFKAVNFKGCDFSFFEDFIRVIKNTTSEELLEISNKYLQIDTMVEAIAGKV